MSQIIIHEVLTCISSHHQILCCALHMEGSLTESNKMGKRDSLLSSLYVVRSLHDFNFILKIGFALNQV